MGPAFDGGVLENELGPYKQRLDKGAGIAAEVVASDAKKDLTIIELANLPPVQCRAPRVASRAWSSGNGRLCLVLDEGDVVASPKGDPESESAELAIGCCVPGHASNSFKPVSSCASLRRGRSCQEVR